MSAFAGRDLRIKVDLGPGVTSVVGARAGTFTWSIETIDVTDKDDAGVRKLLDDIGTKSLDLNVEGVIKDAGLLAAATNATKNTATFSCEILVGALGTLSGNFNITGYEGTGAEGNDPATFTSTFASADTITWTAA